MGRRGEERGRNRPSVRLPRYIKRRGYDPGNTIWTALMQRAPHFGTPVLWRRVDYCGPSHQRVDRHVRALHGMRSLRRLRSRSGVCLYLKQRDTMPGRTPTRVRFVRFSEVRLTPVLAAGHVSFSDRYSKWIVYVAIRILKEHWL